MITLFTPYCLAYFYGDRLVKFCKKYLPHTFLNVCLCYGVSGLWSCILISWASTRRDFALHRPHRLKPHIDIKAQSIIWIDHIPQHIWHDTNQAHADVFQEYNPAWARPFYLMINWTAAYVSALFLYAACVSAPFRMNRCGNAALGKYYSTYMFPWYITFVTYTTSLVGRRAGSALLIVKFCQLGILVSGPLIFVYVWGPAATAIIVAFPKFMMWLPMSIYRRSTFADLKHWVYHDGPRGYREFRDQYISEIRRDVNALKHWLRTWITDPAENLTITTNPARDLFSSVFAVCNKVAHGSAKWDSFFHQDATPLLHNDSHKSPAHIPYYGGVDRERPDEP